MTSNRRIARDRSRVDRKRRSIDARSIARSPIADRQSSRLRRPARAPQKKTPPRRAARRDDGARR
jgi:hypothetical protein